RDEGRADLSIEEMKTFESSRPAPTSASPAFRRCCSDEPQISVIVPAFNEEKLIQRTLRSIQDASTAFLRLGWETEIVVCDNNSSDRTAQLSSAEERIVVVEPINQIARAMNYGGSVARRELTMFVKDDACT